jgi:hypothetical protein
LPAAQASDEKCAVSPDSQSSCPIDAPRPFLATSRGARTERDSAERCQGQSGQNCAH